MKSARVATAARAPPGQRAWTLTNPGGPIMDTKTARIRALNDEKPTSTAQRRCPWMIARI